MRVLHLYSNHKWTGPASLALDSVGGLRALGCEVDFAIAGFVHDGMQHAIRRHAEELGLPLREGLQLRRHFHLRQFQRDAALLAQWIDAGDYDVLHCHQKGDHLVAGLAAARAKRPVQLVRSLWDGRAPRRSLRTAMAFRRTTALTLPFAMPGEARLVRRFGLTPDRVRVVAGPIAERFFTPAIDDAAVAARRRSAKQKLGLDPQRHVVGITARIQRKRRWDLLWDLVACSPHELQFVVLGRPDAGVFDQVCTEPLRKRGAQDRVTFLGYREGADYVEALQALDTFVFLVPGSDATCRALREAMAVGIPVLTTKLGLLPHIVEDGVTGLVREASVDRLAQGLHVLLRDEGVACGFAERARAHAREAWSVERTARDLLALYASLGGDGS